MKEWKSPQFCDSLMYMDRKITILLVDDDRSTRKVYADLLRLAHFEVDESDDGKKALELFRFRKHDVIFSGIDIPGMGGFELVRTIRNLSGKHPFIFINSHTDREEDRAMATDLKVDGYFVKNFHAPLNVINQIKGFFGHSSFEKNIEIHLEKANRFNSIMIFAVVFSATVLSVLGFLVYKNFPVASDSKSQISVISQSDVKAPLTNETETKKNFESVPISPSKVRSFFARVTKKDAHTITLQAIYFPESSSQSVTVTMLQQDDSIRLGSLVEVVLSDFADIQSLSARPIDNAETVRVVEATNLSGQ